MVERRCTSKAKKEIETSARNAKLYRSMVKLIAETFSRPLSGSKRVKNRLAIVAHAAVAFSVFSGIAVAEVELAPVFTDHMVLQRELPVPIWGTAASGEKLTVSFAGQKLETTANDQGRWMIKLKPMKTSKTGQEMIVRGSNTIALSDVLVGEVWLCSGQSNLAGKFSPTKGPIADSKVPEKIPSGSGSCQRTARGNHSRPLRREGAPGLHTTSE